MTAELGRSFDPQAFIPGDPASIARDLRALLGNIEKMSSIAEGLGGIDPGQWSGDAAQAFRTAFGKEPGQWLDTIGVLGKGANALADYGDALTWAQSEAQRAIDLYTQSEVASKAAAAQAQQSGAPFGDPGQHNAGLAQQVLDNARSHLGQAGDLAAKAFGFGKNDDGTYSKDLGGKEFDKSKGGERSFGSQSGGLLTDRLDPVLKALGIDPRDESVSASGAIDVAHGSLTGQFGSDTFGGKGTLDGSVLGADGQAQGSANILGVSGSASGEAYLAKGSAEGDAHLGQHVSAKGEADGMVGADGSAEGKLSWAGIQAGGEAFAGAKANGSASAEVGGVTAGANGSLSAGLGANASGQFGMGDDGKFHVGASIGATLGIGANLGFDVSVDPKEVASTVSDVAGDAEHVASSVAGTTVNLASDAGNAMLSAGGAAVDGLSKVGDGLGSLASGAGDFVGGLFD